MNKYVVIGGIDLFIGLFQILIPLVQILFVIPKVYLLYQDVGVAVPNQSLNYLVLGLIVVGGVLNSFVGLNLLLSSKLKKEKYFTYGWVLFIVNLLFLGLLVAFLSLSTILPIYQVTTQFQ